MAIPDSCYYDSVNYDSSYHPPWQSISSSNVHPLPIHLFRWIFPETASWSTFPARLFGTDSGSLLPLCLRPRSPVLCEKRPKSAQHPDGPGSHQSQPNALSVTQTGRGAGEGGWAGVPEIGGTSHVCQIELHRLQPSTASNAAGFLGTTGMSDAFVFPRSWQAHPQNGLPQALREWAAGV